MVGGGAPAIIFKQIFLFLCILCLVTLMKMMFFDVIESFGYYNNKTELTRLVAQERFL